MNSVIILFSEIQYDSNENINIMCYTYTVLIIQLKYKNFNII